MVLLRLEHSGFSDPGFRKNAQICTFIETYTHTATCRPATALAVERLSLPRPCFSQWLLSSPFVSVPRFKTVHEETHVLELTGHVDGILSVESTGEEGFFEVSV